MSRPDHGGELLSASRRTCTKQTRGSVSPRRDRKHGPRAQCWYSLRLRTVFIFIDGRKNTKSSTLCVNDTEFRFQCRQTALLALGHALGLPVTTALGYRTRWNCYHGDGMASRTENIYYLCLPRKHVPIPLSAARLELMFLLQNKDVYIKLRRADFIILKQEP